MLIDTHCHLSFKAFDDSWSAAVKRARDKDIQMICVGAAKATSEKSIAIAESSDGVFAAIGLHPTHTDEVFDFDWFEKAADNSKVVAIGETGIDHYHIEDKIDVIPAKAGIQGNKKEVDPRFRGDDKKTEGGEKNKRVITLQHQEDLLRQHLMIAREKKLPVILHARDGKTESLKPSPNPSLEGRGLNAYDHLLKIIKDFGYFNGVMHCFGGNWEIAKKVLDLGLMISFTGIVTFKNASESLKEVVRNVPLDRFMIETDSPYLAPEPHRGKTNEPAFVEHAARGIATIRGVDYDTVTQATTANAKKFFGI